MQSRSLVIELLAGYSPTIRRLVGMLGYARQTTLVAVAGLGIAELDFLYDGTANSIGALLAHIAVVERGYACLTLEERVPSEAERLTWEPALTLGAEGRHPLRGQPLEHCLENLHSVRRASLDGLAARDDAWLERPMRVAPAMNAHWAWFHVVEEEINHRGQIRWLCARLRALASGSAGR